MRLNGLSTDLSTPSRSSGHVGPHSITALKSTMCDTDALDLAKMTIVGSERAPQVIIAAVKTPQVIAMSRQLRRFFTVRKPSLLLAHNAIKNADCSWPLVILECQKT
jgi:hypothetical protein